MIVDERLKKLNTEAKLRGFSPQTIKMYLFYNQKLLDYTRKEPVDITEDDIKDFLRIKTFR